MAGTTFFNKRGRLIAESCNLFSYPAQRSYSLKEEVGSTTENEYLSIFSPSAQRAPIRDHLKNWQQQHERLSANQREAFQTPITGIDGAAQNPVSQSGVDNSLNSIDRDDLSPEESHHFDETLSESQSGSLPKNSFLRKGDVVELRYIKSLYSNRLALS